MAWTYEQKFNGLTTGDLNGQDSWASSTSFDVTEADSYEGAKSVTATAANAVITRSVTAVSSGTLYFAMMRPDTNADSNFDLLTSSATALRIRIAFQVSNITLKDGTGNLDLVTGYTNSQWYVFEINFDASNQHTVRVHDGTSWSELTASRAAATNGDIDGVRFNQGNAGTAYWDTITPTNPVVATNGKNLLLLGVG